MAQGFCTRCGLTLEKADSFCPRCGTARYRGASDASVGGDSAPQNPSAPRNFGTPATASKPAAPPSALAVLVAIVVVAVTVWIGAGYLSSARYSSANLMAGGTDRGDTAQNQGGFQLPLGRNDAGPFTTTLSIPANQPWTDTSISVTAGQPVSISASGSIYVGALSNPSLDYESPQGSGVVFANGYGCSVNPGTRFPHIAPGLACWSLIGKVGADGVPFQVGASVQLSAPASGELYLGVNDNVFGDNSGSWTATITTTGMRPAPSLAGAGLYGSTNSANQDRNAELQANCGPFSRVYAAGDTFGQLCDQLHLNCAYVCDWEGRMQPCGSNVHDGSRVVSCQPMGTNNGIGMPPAPVPTVQPIQDHSDD